MGSILVHGTDPVILTTSEYLEGLFTTTGKGGECRPSADHGQPMMLLLCFPPKHIYEFGHKYPSATKLTRELANADV